MQCPDCGLEQPESSKYCGECGARLEDPFRCAQCGFHNPEDSKFCMECGERLSGTQKTKKGPQRKCRCCGSFNDLDAIFCVTCGEKMIQKSKDNITRNPLDPSLKNIILVIASVIILVLIVQKGLTLFQGKKPPQISSSAIPYTTPASGVDEDQVYAVAQNFICACGGCGEEPLETCACDMPKGSVEEKNYIRAKLAEGLTVEQVIELVDKKYGHRK